MRSGTLERSAGRTCTRAAPVAGWLQGPASGPSLMATEPVGRSRIRSDEVVVPGRAIPRMCHGEEDEEWLAQRDHLVEECERAIDLFVKRWDALQRHANWDRRQGA